ncbi:hypothetical protein [Paraburkholderia youngii]|uniref:hypothetical protein n=1 Tax=Paraburkholderia youngii TaxID=2782701 RepID=UPI003D211425
MPHTSSSANRHSRSYSTPRRRVIWATFPFNGRLGVYVAVAHAGGEVTVALRCDGGYRWLKAADCLTDAEARSWVRWGFKHAF